MSKQELEFGCVIAAVRYTKYTMDDAQASQVSSTSQAGTQLFTHIRFVPTPSVRARIEIGDDPDDLVAKEHTRFAAVSRETIAADVRLFVTELHNRALISVG